MTQSSERQRHLPTHTQASRTRMLRTEWEKIRACSSLPALTRTSEHHGRITHHARFGVTLVATRRAALTSFLPTCPNHRNQDPPSQSTGHGQRGRTTSSYARGIQASCSADGARVGCSGATSGTAAGGGGACRACRILVAISCTAVAVTIRMLCAVGRRAGSTAMVSTTSDCRWLVHVAGGDTSPDRR